MKHFNSDRPRFASYGFTCEIWTPKAMPRADQHDEIELNYVPSGTLTYLMGGRRVTIPSRRLTAFWATIPHQIVEYEGDSPYYVVTIPFRWFLKWGLPRIFHNQLLRWETVMDFAQPRPELECLQFEQWTKDAQQRQLMQVVALEIQARVLRMAESFPDENSNQQVPPPAQLPYQGKAEQMAIYISRRYQERLMIADIASEVDLHPGYAATLFKKTFGTTVVNFITRHRIAHAQRLLLSTEDLVITIGGDSGFDSVSRFNRAFKQLTGLTPREYRKRNLSPPIRRDSSPDS